MGIRVHKLIGYGSVDVKYDKQAHKICDERLNLTSFEKRHEDLRRFDRQHYLRWLRKQLPPKKPGVEENYSETFELRMEMRHADKRLRDNRDRKRWFDPWDCVFHDGEFGLPNVLAIVPYTERASWCRYDDMIDYMEEGKGAKGRRVCVYGDGLYPWIGNYCDIRTGERKDTDIACTYRRYMNTKPSRRSGYTLQQLRTHASRLAAAMGFKSLDECSTYLRPVVPTCVRLLCEFCEIFKDPMMIRQLQPLLYVYWS